MPFVCCLPCTCRIRRNANFPIPSILEESSDRIRPREQPGVCGGVPLAGTQGVAGNGCASRGLEFQTALERKLASSGLRVSARTLLANPLASNLAFLHRIRSSILAFLSPPFAMRRMGHPNKKFVLAENGSDLAQSDPRQRSSASNTPDRQAWPRDYRPARLRHGPLQLQMCLLPDRNGRRAI